MTTIDWAGICGLPHEDTDAASGLGLGLYDRGEDGHALRECENCLSLRADFEWWLRNREGAAA